MSNKMTKEPVVYKDSQGRTWSAVPGEPNGCFRLPDSPVLYSLQSWRDFLINMIKKNVASVKVVGHDEIIDGGTIDFEAALELMGEPTPRKIDQSKKTKVRKEGGGKEKNIDKIKKVLEDFPDGLTKKEIADRTKIPLASVKNEVKSQDLVIVGKVKTENKYGLKK